MIIEPYVIIENQDFNSSEDIILLKSRFDSIDYKDGRTTFVFRNCKFQHINIINNEEIDFPHINFLFSYCLINSFYIHSLITKNISITFSNCILSARINNNNIGFVSFSNCFIKSHIFLTELSSLTIVYDENIIDLRKWKIFLNKYSLNFNDYLENSFNIYEPKNFTFHIRESDSGIKGIYNNRYKNAVGYRFNNFEKNNFNFSLSIFYSVAKEHKATRIINSKLKCLEIKGYSNGKIEIENSQIDNIYLNNLTCKEGANFYDLKPFRITEHSENKFEISRCNLDEFWFDNVIFNEYKIISFYRNKFVQTNFSSCEFPNSFNDFEKFITVKNIHYPSSKDTNYNKLRYETFLQLKKALENSGNYFESQKFQSFTNELLLNIDSIPYWDKFILKINSFSNNHGISIEKPFVWLLRSSIILYILYLITLRRIFIYNADIDWNLFGYYFSFLDLTHRSDFLVDKEELNGFSLMIDYLNKLVIGFFIYQFIAAFRKYGKK